MGVNSTNASFDGDGGSFSPDAKINFQLGAFYDIPVSDRVVISPEINYVGRGYKLDFDFLGATTESKVNLSYLDIGLLGKFNLVSDEAFGFYAGLGPVYSYAMSGKVDTDGTETDIEFDDNDGFNRSNLNLATFIGATFSERYFIEARYMLGLSDLSDDNGTSSKWNSIGLNIGTRFGLGY